jgi:MFS family permease
MVTPRFLLVMGATLAYYVCVGVMVPVLPVFIENGTGAGEAMVGAAAVAFSIAAVVARPLITWVGVHLGRRSMMWWGSVLSVGAALGLVVVTEPWQVLPLRALMGIGEAGLFVGASTVVVELSPANRRAEAASYLSLSVFGGLAIGPFLGEWTLGDVPAGAVGLGVGRFDAAFVLVAAAAALSAVVSLAAPRWIGERPAPTGFTLSWIERSAVVPGLVLASGIVAWTAFAVFVPTYAKEIGLSGSAGFFTMYSVICLVLRFIGARWPERFGLRRTVLGAMVALVVGSIVVASMASGTGILIGTAFMGLGMSFLYPSLLAMSVHGTDDTRRVAVVSSFTMFFEVGSATGGLVLGLVGEAFGKRSTFVGGAIFAVIGVVLLSARRPNRVEAVSVAGG